MGGFEVHITSIPAPADRDDEARRIKDSIRSRDSSSRKTRDEGRLTIMDRYGQRTHYVPKTKFMLQTTPFLVPGRSNPFVLLQQTCRQIYTETAMLPLSGLNYIWYLDDLALQTLRKRLLPVQFYSITKLVFFVSENVDMPSATGNFDPARVQNLRLLTGLKYIRIVVLIKLDSVRGGPYSMARWIENPTFARIQAGLEPIFLEAVPEGVELDFELRRSSDSDVRP